MRQRLFCDSWQFLKTDLETDNMLMVAHRGDFVPVCLPHDWMIYDTANLYENSIGWYLRSLSLEELQTELGYEQGERVTLRFDGVYMDSTVYVNGKQAAEWKYGYSAFDVDITEYLTEEANEILVKVVYQSPNSRWYSGAGIYRNVWLRVSPVTYLVSDGIYTSVKEQGEDFILSAEAEIAGRGAGAAKASFILTGPDGSVQELGGQDTLVTGDDGVVKAAKEVLIKNPLRWDITAPNLYKLSVKVTADNGVTDENGITDEDTVTLGFRTIRFDPDNGFFLNGRYVKVHGVCEHHDLGCLGSAFNEAAQRRKFKILQEMGVNAVRTSHNMPAKELMDIADEMGMLIMSEAFDMWERCKTTYDYGRFFIDWAERDVASWIRRDRNHPSLILWSIGNEIYDTHADEHGQEITRRLIGYVREHDPKENAPITIGSNFMPWENAQKCADIVKLAGYNYGEKCYDEHHAKYPDWMIYGSETSSIVQSRGVYHFPYRQSVLADEDEQCSALGNSTTSWGAKSVEKCIADDRDAAYTFGQFLWTGFDYIGEPTPYHTKNSYFGQIDTAGFAKDAFYIYQAEWTDVKKSPMVHVFPYWDFNEGQMIDVRACSNGAAVELFVNGTSRGRQDLHHDGGTQFTATWQVPYIPGEIKAVAYDEDGKAIAEEVRHSFSDAVRITVTPDRQCIRADGRDAAFLEIAVTDADGYPVENAMNYVQVSVEGDALLAGLDNGDSTDYDSYKGCVRKLFNGKLLAVVQAGTAAGEVKVTVTGQGLAPATVLLTLEDAEACKGTGDWKTAQVPKLPCTLTALPANVPVRKLELTSAEGCTLTAEKPETIVEAKLYPENATDKEVVFKAVTDGGIEIDYAQLTPIEGEPLKVRVKALGDGDFRIRCMSKSGTEKIRLISQLELHAEGLGEAYLNPYGFITGGLYAETIGEIGNGNEKGFATARGEESGVVFTGVDFGKVGSDEINMPLFTLSGAPYTFQIWEGRPGEREDGLLLDSVYQKPSIWNVYQPETYKLNRRLIGVTDISFVFHDKVHMKGFSFTKYEKAFEKLFAASCDEVYGDNFVREEESVTGIGNNVTLVFDDMHFGESGAKSLSICGRSSLPVNTIHVRFTYADGTESRQIVEFAGAEEYTERSFALEPVTGDCKVSFVFLPGSSFDFQAFQFHTE